MELSPEFAAEDVRSTGLILYSMLAGGEYPMDLGTDAPKFEGGKWESVTSKPKELLIQMLNPNAQVSFHFNRLSLSRYY